MTELRQIRDFLAAHEPYASLPPAALAGLPSTLTVRYYRRGTALRGIGDTADAAFIVRAGAVDIRDADGALVDRADVGSTFGASALLDERPSRYAMTAFEDTLALLVPAPVLRRLAEAHPAFAAHFEPGRLRRAVLTAQTAESGVAVLRTSVGELVTGEPVSCAPSDSVRDAAQVMARRRISSLLVVEDGRLTGILTDRDLRTRVVAAGLDTGRPVAAVMTPSPITVPSTALAFEALLLMVDRSFHHLPVIGPEGVAGVITSTDLLRLEHANPVFLVGEIAKAPDVAALTRLTARLPRLVGQLVAQDVAASDITRVVTAIGDAVEARLVALAEARLGPAPGRWCWICLGSRARREQGLGSDQDHGMILADDAPAEDPWFAGLATFVVDGLEACGYPRCRGEVMAVNPAWRQPLAAWKATFHRWMAEPEPDAVMRATIFFDLRGTCGDLTLAEDLRTSVLAEARESRIFLAQLGKHATDRTPPLGFLRGFVVERAGEHRDALDLKAGGVAAVHELVRVIALARGLPETGTVERIRAAVAAGAMDGRAGQDLEDAFELISHVRLAHQAGQVAAGGEPDSWVRPDDLSSFDRRALRDAFAVVRRAQEVLTSTLGLHYTS